MGELVRGVGINDSNYPIKLTQTVICEDGKKKEQTLWACPFYVRWNNMLKRCYSEKLGAKVCDEWLTFSNFKTWMEQQDWEGKELDKDLLIKGNKIYSPETCLFISGIINKFISEGGKARGKYPCGVYFDNYSNRFKTQCHNPFTKKYEHLGRFDTPEEAQDAWLARKLALAILLAAQQDDPKVSELLIQRYQNYERL